MLSICIPIYNLNVTQLIQDLSKQAKLTAVPYEIILIDDCSLKKYKAQNEAICAKEIYIKLPKNIGRAKIRNHFLNFIKYDNLLFLDCDSTIILENYIAHYIKIITTNKNYDVLFGGSIYNNKKPKRNKMLRWKYGTIKESKPLNIRTLNANKSFMTNNFLIHKKVFEKVQFDERITEYGHEDTLFGYELKKNNYKITHINNVVLNGNIEDNIEYLKKTEKSINNLTTIVKYVNNDPELIKNIALLDFYEKMKAKKLINSIYFLFNLTEPILKFLFIKGYVNLKLFDFYKLGILIKRYKN